MESCRNLYLLRARIIFCRVRVKAFALDLEASSPLEFLDSSWARSYLPAWWRSEEVRYVAGNQHN